jgi:ubiquinone/menaquinone biosynthesis C-methylase UbiE
MMTSEIERLRHMYATQYNPDPQDRNYIWHPLNPVSIYYRQAQERAIAELFRVNGTSLTKLHVLDIGCGNGGLLRFLASLGTSPDLLSGIDLMYYRINAARQLAPPGTSLLVGNAETLPYPEQCFDLVAQFTVLSSILDAQLRQRVATEMMRVLKRGGHILWYDMYKAGNTTLHSLSMLELHQLFPAMEVRHLKRLHPIYATRILRYSRLLSALWETLPGLPKTHYMILLQKP